MSHRQSTHVAFDVVGTFDGYEAMGFFTGEEVQQRGRH
jgi:hypothetical protein